MTRRGSIMVIAVLAIAGCRLETRRAASIASGPNAVLRAPDGSAVPSGPLGASIVRGHAIMLATGDSLPAHVGNGLRCVSCHLGDGRSREALPLTGVYARFPQYRARAGAVQTIEDRINGCLLRSMNGSALAPDDPAMRALVAYLAFISRGVPVGDTLHLTLLAVSHGDTTAGAEVFQRACARCHGVNGAGQAAYPPLWGPRSFNIGAGMARLRTAATFIYHNMPQDRPGSLSQRDAVNVAAYVISRPRPDLPGKEHDWPNGDAPPDAAYPTLASPHR